MHRNTRASRWKKGLPPRAEMVLTGFDWHEEISSTVDGPHPLSVNSENASDSSWPFPGSGIRDEIDHRLALFRRGCRMLRFVGLYFESRVLRSAACFRCRYRRFILTERAARQ